MRPSESLKIAILAARRAGTIQRERFGTGIEVRNKGAVDLVTEVDLACEEAIRETIGKQAPDHAIVGEEGGLTGTGDKVWYIDPLDGTTNFARGVPIFCVSIGYAEGGSMVSGVVYDPLRDELFATDAGGGATLNSRPIGVTNRSDLDSALLATGFAYDYRTTDRKIFEAFALMYKSTIGLRRLGAAALDLCYVAAGRFDGYWELGLKPWDTAAGSLLVREAGGRTTGLGGEPYDHLSPDIVATNGKIHDAALSKLAAFFG